MVRVALREGAKVPFLCSGTHPAFTDQTIWACAQNDAGTSGTVVVEAALACAGITQASTARARNIRRRPMLPRISDDLQVALSDSVTRRNLSVRLPQRRSGRHLLIIVVSSARYPSGSMKTLPTSDLAHTLIALAAILLCAHGMGSLFVRFRQPRAIGEVLGGLLLGATVLGWLSPSAQAWIFPTGGSTPVILSAVYQLGLLLLLFIAGSELRTVFHRGERRTVAAVFVAGTTIPFVAGLGISQMIDQRSLWGPNGNTTSFVLVFSIALAITSIPVISRIMHDLGILDTAFARVVLGVAVLEDLVLYVVLATAIGFAGTTSAALFGLPSALGITTGSQADLAYHVTATLAFLAAFLVAGPPAYRWIGSLQLNVIHRATPIAHQLTFMLLTTAAALMLGLEAFFGAFVAGIIVAATESKPSQATLAIRSFSLAFFIPVYFAGIGLGLDLIHGFDVVFFIGFLLAACFIKATSVYLGARAAGEDGFGSLNLAIAMNARGGPGIVVASTAFSAGIIDQDFFAVLVLLAIITSLAAGTWLERVPRERLLSRPETTAGRAVGVEAETVV
ncbi:MAG TPA: cation:proton antiporter [Gaiellales bacterium]|nr:cation:proton antiporter [Gaiellales bacterium]